MNDKKLRNYIRQELRKATFKIITDHGVIGTGFFISPDGYFLTAYHCVVDMLVSGKNRFPLKLEFIEGRGLSFDEVYFDKDKSDPRLDFAVLRLNHQFLFPCLPLGVLGDEHIESRITALGFAGASKPGRGLGFYRGNISRFMKYNPHWFEPVLAIQGEGQSGGPIYHYDTHRVVGLAVGIQDDLVSAGVAVKFDALFEKWPALKEINGEVALSWTKRVNELSCFSRTRIHELKALFSRIKRIPGDDDLRSLCYEVMPRPRKLAALPECQGEDTLLCLLDWLAQSLSDAGPILDFTARLLRFKEFEPVQDEIKAWIRDVSPNFSLSRSDTDALIHRQTTAPVTKAALKPDAYLLISLAEEEKKKPRQYRVKAWVFQDDDITPLDRGIAETLPASDNSASQKYSFWKRLFRKCEPETEKNDNPCPDLENNTFTLGEMPQVVKYLLKTVYKNFGISKTRLTIEFFLPFHLLSYHVDQWPRENECLFDDEAEEPFGCRSRIVVRSKERFEDEDLSSNLDDYWNADFLAYKPEECVRRLKKGDSKGLINDLEKGKIFFVLKFAPDTKFIAKLIRMGTPFMLWPRKLKTQDDVSKLTTLLCNECRYQLEGVPEMIRQERRKIVDGDIEEAYITYPVSLLWDDPRRKPPEVGSEKNRLPGFGGNAASL
jgi:hypothetical protein